MRIISPQLSPNATWRDVLFAYGSLLNPLRWIHWKEGKAVGKLESVFSEHFEGSAAVSFHSGRTALQAIIETLQLSENDEVVLQAFTCVVVPNSIIAAGAKPRYVDIDRTYNIDVEKLERIIGEPQVKAVIVQHTFGVPADILRIQQLCKDNDVFLIEDCAHSLGASVAGKEVGTFGDAAMFSFGRDKIISSVSGGMAITRHEETARALEVYQSALPHMSRFRIWQHLNHPVIFSVAKRLYTLILGKLLIVVSRLFRMWPKVLEHSEKKGHAAEGYKMPNILARLALQQFERLDEINMRRKSIAKTYMYSLGKISSIRQQGITENSRPVFLRFSFTSEGSEQLLEKGKKNAILLGDWYRNIIDPKGSSLKNVGYTDGSCPNAERIAQVVVNLPTHPNMRSEDVKRVANFIQENTQ